MATRILLRRDTSANWTSANPTLSAGEMGVESDTNLIKIGRNVNGTLQSWSQLPYLNVTPSDLSSTLNDYLETSLRGVADGVAALDSNGFVPVEQLPPLVKVTVNSVANQAARLALVAEPGDIAIQTDNGASYVLSDSPASTNDNWKEFGAGNEKVQDIISTTILDGTGLDKSYNDDLGTLTLSIDSTVATLDGAQTLTTKTINLSHNTISGTISQFNTALSDGSFVTLDGVETLTNKTLTSPILNTPQIQTINNGNVVITVPGTTGTLILESQAHDYTDTEITALGIAIASDISDAISSVTTNGSLSGTTFSGTISLPSTTSIGDITATQIGYLSTISSNVQSQIETKAPNANPTFTGTVTLPGDPGSALQAATKQYVDSVAEGLHVHAAAVAATTENINLSTDVENGDTLDGVVLATGNRILVKNQTTASQNGIYVVSASGAPTRALDFDSPAEIDGGDFIFVTGGTVNDNTGWVQTNVVGTVGSDPLQFTQFAGYGTITAGTNIIVNGNQVSTVSNPTFSSAIIGDVSNTEIQYIAGVTSSIQSQIDSKAPSSSPTFTGTVSGITKSMVGLGNVDNTSDANKPVSTATQSALDLKANLASATFTGTVIVPAPTVSGSAVTKAYVDDVANSLALSEIIPFDDLSGRFNGSKSRFTLTHRGSVFTVGNPLRLLISINGIIQVLGNRDDHWLSPIPADGFYIDADGMVQFGEPVQAGSKFEGRYMVGQPTAGIKKSRYPFRAVDILLGA